MPIDNKKLKIFIAVDIVVMIFIVYYFMTQQNRAPASIPDHKKMNFQSIDKYDKPRSAIRLKADRIEVTEHDTFILRVSAKFPDESTELHFAWNLPETVRVFNGDVSGTLVFGESDKMEIEIALDNPKAVTDIGLEVFYEQNGIKLGSVKNFQLNKPTELSNKFQKAKAAFEEELEKSDQKIIQ